MPVDTGAGIGGATLGAFGGALVGSWFGDGFGNNNRNGYPAGAPVAAVASGIETSIVLDQLTALNSGINGVNTSVLTSTNQITQGLCNLGFQDSQNTAQIINATNQGFSGLNTSIQASGFESRLATQSLESKLAECCCETQKTIITEGQTTRALIDRYAYESLQTQLCDSKAHIASLEANAFTAKSNGEQTNVILHHLAMVGGGKSA